jgi:hypothetical protein
MKKLFTLLVLLSTISTYAQVDFDKKLKELGVELFPPTKSMGD